jgi:hypothetical protein
MIVGPLAFIAVAVGVYVETGARPKSPANPAASYATAPPSTTRAAADSPASMPNDAPGPMVLIFLRTEAESQLADIVTSELKPAPIILPPRSDADLDLPYQPHDECFIFYADPSLVRAAQNLAGKLEKIQALKGFCPEGLWGYGTYTNHGRRSLFDYVAGQAPFHHLLITFPKSPKKKYRPTKSKGKSLP